MPAALILDTLMDDADADADADDGTFVLPSNEEEDNCPTCVLDTVIGGCAPFHDDMVCCVFGVLLTTFRFAVIFCNAHFRSEQLTLSCREVAVVF